MYNDPSYVVPLGFNPLYYHDYYYGQPWWWRMNHRPTYNPQTNAYAATGVGNALLFLFVILVILIVIVMLVRRNRNRYYN